MANVTIPQLNPIIDIDDADALPIDNGAQTLKITIAQLKEIIGSSIQIPRGVMLPTIDSNVPDGYLSCMGTTIGQGTGYSDEIYFPIYEMIWVMGGLTAVTGHPFTLQGVKGESARLDWVAGKTITIDFATNGLTIKAKPSALNLGAYQRDAVGTNAGADNVGMYRNDSGSFHAQGSFAGHITYPGSAFYGNENGGKMFVAVARENRVKSVLTNWIVKY